MGACTWASGSQVCTGHIGIFTAKLAKKATQSSVCIPPAIWNPITVIGVLSNVWFSRLISQAPMQVVPACTYMPIIATSISTEPRNV